MLDKLATYFHENYYPDLNKQDVVDHLQKPEVLDTAINHLHENHYSDVPVQDLKNQFIVDTDSEDAQEGPVKPIIVKDKNDPRLKAYNDSLELYNKSKAAIKRIGNLSEKDTPVYLRKDVSPKEILSKDYDFVNSQGYNTSGRFDSNMNPNNNFLKQKILPIAGIGVNAENSKGGWYDIYKKPSQPIQYKSKVEGNPKFEDFYKTINPDYNDTSTYNLREAYDNLPYKKLKAWKDNPNKNHLPDTYKLPNHPTFSNESKYYKEGMPAVRWEGDTPVPINQKKEAIPTYKDSLDSYSNYNLNTQKIKNPNPIDSTYTKEVPHKEYDSPTKFYQGYRFMNDTGLKPGWYHPEQIDEAVKLKDKK